jgi:MYXO-CTERM domain-containing protein
VIAPSNNADFNGNGVVDGADFLVWQRGFGLAGQPNKSTGDANGDGSVNAADLTIWKTQFGTSPGVTGAVASVPEPAAGALAVGALAAVARRRRRASR